jgi:molybdate transport system substrate-binding protein
MRRRALLALPVAALACARRPSPAARRRVAVAAAADLRFVLAELLDALRAARPDLRVEPSFGASGSLVAQITQGAPFDVFLSADESLARDLVARGLADERGRFRYARGHLALWAPRSLRLDVAALGLRALLDPAVRRVAIANPRHAPYGRAAVAALAAAGLTDAVAPKLVAGENVAQAMQMAQSGAAEVALVARALTRAPGVASEGQVYVVPAGLHPPIEQGGVVLRRAGDPAAAADFADFLRSPAARGIFARHGFDPPAP